MEPLPLFPEVETESEPETTTIAVAERLRDEFCST
jgi:hypothetical protein